MRMRWALLAGAAPGIIIGLLIGFRANAGPSVIIEKASADHVAYAGGYITVHASIKHTKDCPVLLHHWLDSPNDKDGKWYPIDDYYAPPMPVGRLVSFDINIPVRPSTPRGEYILRGRAQDQCGLFSVLSQIRDSSYHVNILPDPAGAPVEIK